MTIVRFSASTSLDGFLAGPNQSEENPLGEGGMALFADLREPPPKLEQGQAIEAPGVTHLRYRVAHQADDNPRVDAK